MNTPNQIPEEVLKTWEETAEVNYGKDPDFYPNKIRERKNDYLRGRQDEWERQRAEVERLKGLINWAWRKAIYYCEEQGESDGIRWDELHGWEAFKTKHNL